MFYTKLVTKNKQRIKKKFDLQNNRSKFVCQLADMYKGGNINA